MNNPDFTFAPNDPPEPVEPEAAPPPREEAPPPAPAKRGPSLLTLLLFLVLAGGLYVVWADPPQLARYTAGGAVQRLQAQVKALSAQDSEVAAQSQALSQQVQALADRVDRLEKTAAPAPASPAASGAPDVSGLQKQVADLSSKVDALASRPADAAQTAAPSADNGAAQQALSDLSQKVQQATAAQAARLDQLESQQKSDADALRTRMDQLEKGAGQVEGVATRANVLTRVQAAEVALLAGQKLGDIPGAPPALARFANKAPPTDAQLREEFPDVADHARGVSQPDLASKSFLERSWARLQESVTVRQGDDVLIGDPAAGILADAQAKVNSDDLQGAVAALQKLHGPAADAVAPWVERANALLAARAALAAMAAHS